MHTVQRLFGLTAALCLTLSLATSSPSFPQHRTFIANMGQWPSHVLFGVRSTSADIWITRTGLVVDEYTQSGDVRTGRVYAQDLSNAAPSGPGSIEPGVPAGTVSFMRGNANTWFTAQAYKSVVLRDVAPGVSMAYAIDSYGRVVRETFSDGRIQLSTMTEVTRLGKGDNVQSSAPSPSTVFGAYLGGNNEDYAAGVRYMSSGDVVIAGSTTAMTFPGTIGGYAKNIKGELDGYVMRCDPTLSTVKALTYIGGTMYDRLRDIIIDDKNNVYICGETKSSDIPVSSSASSKIYKAELDAFVVKLDSTLTKLLVGLYHGGNKDDIPTCLAVDKVYNIYLCGYTTSTSGMTVTTPQTTNLTWTTFDNRGRPTNHTVPLSNGRTNMGLTDGFVVVFTDYGGVSQARYYGREGNERFTYIHVDGAGYIYLGGTTTSQTFEATPARNNAWNGRVAYDASYNGGASDAFVLKTSSSLTFSQSDGITFSTLLGGDGVEEVRALQLDERNLVYAILNSTSTNLPVEGSGLPHAGKQDVYYARLDAVGGALSGGSYFGGSGDDDARAAQFANGSNRYMIAGTTNSVDLAVVGDGAKGERDGLTDGLLAVLNAGVPEFVSLAGGVGEDTIVDITPDIRNDAFYVMSSTSNDLPTHGTSFAKTPTGESHAYVAKHAFGIMAMVSPKGGETFCAGGTHPITWSAAGVNDTTKYRIQYAPVGTETWTDIMKAASGRNYSWKVPANLPLGQYNLRITTINGHESIVAAPIFVSTKPSITKQPANANGCVGGNVTLKVEASGVNLAYQWRKAGQPITDATQAELTLGNLTTENAGSYDCIVSGGCNPSATSIAATVVVTPGAAITQQPSNVTIEEKQSFTLKVVATGTGITYQWKKDGVAISGATKAEYAVANATKADAGEYSCDIISQCGTITSATATVSINEITSVDEDASSAATWASVIGPNPADDRIALRLNLANTSAVTVRIIDMQGQTIVSQQSGVMPAGVQVVYVSTRDCSPAAYAIEVQAGSVVNRLTFAVQR
jgi:hypothetical protein